MGVRKCLPGGAQGSRRDRRGSGPGLSPGPGGRAGGIKESSRGCEHSPWAGWRAEWLFCEQPSPLGKLWKGLGGWAQAHVPPGREGPGRAHSAGGPEGGPGPDTGPQAWGDSAFPRWTSQRPHDGHFLSRLSLGGRRGPPGTSRTTTTARNVTLCHPDGCVSSLGSEQVK